jgi:hydroxymethylpyrimidine pyrophosphatase-like HAD family hydrolase
VELKSGEALDWGRIQALACDYDGTLAHEGVVAEATVAALGRFKASGRRLLMVTGRELAPLKAICPALGLFDLVVCENGAELYWPARDAARLLATPPTPAFLTALAEAGIDGLNVGHSIVAAPIEGENGLATVIARVGNDWRLIRNKDSVMALPPGVDKASGLVAGLRRLGLEARVVMGVGDAENDEPFLNVCGVSAAVANALPALKTLADVVTRGADGAGVAELIDKVLSAVPA